MAKWDDPIDPQRAEYVAAMRDFGRFYYEALGRFIAEYSHLENELYLFLVNLTGMKLRAANAVLSGAKTDTCISFVRRIYTSQDQPIPKQLGELLVHIAELNNARNEILHHGAHYDVVVSRVVSNDLKVHTPKNLKRWRLTTTMLESMAADAEKAWRMVRVYTLELQGAPIKRTEALTRAWRYKPPQGLLEVPRRPDQSGSKQKKAQPSQPRSGKR